MKRPPLHDLIRRVAQAMTAAYTKQEPGLTLPQSVILRALLQNGPVNQTQLRACTGVDRSTMCDVLRRLATDGMLINVRMQNDRRAMLVSITPSGRVALFRAEKALAKAEFELIKLVRKAKRPYFRDALEAIAEGAISE